MQRSNAFDMLRRVRGELDAGRFALTEVLRATRENLNFLQSAHKSGVSESELRRCANNLETTFILRLFSEFEAILRDFWTATVRPTRPGMKPLMDSIAARRNIIAAHLTAAHSIRDFRNDIIHENLRDLRFTFPDCAGIGQVFELASRCLVRLRQQPLDDN